MDSKRFFRMRETSLVLVLVAMSLGAAGQQFQVVKVGLAETDRAAAMGNARDHAYIVQVRNTGPEASRVVGIVTSGAPGVVVIEGILDFGDMAAGEIVASRSPFTLRHRGTRAIDTQALSFRFYADHIPPIANAGADRRVEVGDTVALDGSRSFHPDGEELKFHWSLVSAPPGVEASLSNADRANPTFVALAPGTYELSLVVDDGRSSSAPATVTIWTGPIADAGADMTVKRGERVQLQGGNSFDGDGKDLNFKWSLVARPAGSKAVLSDTRSANPTFEADVEGRYEAQLVVDNGRFASQPRSTSIDAMSTPLVAGSLVSGSISGTGEIDQYSFAGQANQIVTITLVNTSGFPYPSRAWMKLTGPNATFVTQFGANGQQQITLAQTGTYQIDVYASDLVSLGSYNLGIESLRPVNPVDRILPCGGLLSGVIGVPGRVRQITFDGTASQIVTLTLVQTAGFPYPSQAWAKVIAPSGSLAVQFGAHGQQQITLLETGTYVVQVMASGLVSTGNFKLGLECLKPANPVDAALPCGSLYSGAISSAGQVDQIGFSGTGNQIVTLTLVQTAGFPYPSQAWAKVISPSGALVVQFGANGQQQIRLPETGLYIVQVMASGLVSTGSYKLGRECVVPPAPVDSPLPCGSLYSGTISSAGQVDQIGFSGTANQIVTLTLVQTAGFPYPSQAWAKVHFAQRRPGGPVRREWPAADQTARDRTVHRPGDGERPG